MSSHPPITLDDSARMRAIQVWERRVELVRETSPKSAPVSKAPEKKQQIR